MPESFKKPIQPEKPKSPEEEKTETEKEKETEKEGKALFLLEEFEKLTLNKVRL